MLLVNCSLLPWVDHRLKRNQAIFSTLLKETSAFSAGIYINPPTIERQLPHRVGTSPKIVCREGPPTGPTQPIIVELSYGLADWYVHAVRLRWAKRIWEQLHKTVIKSERFCLWMNCPGRLSNALAVEMAPHATVRIFDSSDDFKAWPGTSLTFFVDELVALADRVLCVNSATADGLFHPRKRVFSNCTEWSAFQSRDEEVRLPPYIPKPQGEKYIGFIGGIQESRADEVLLHRLFCSFPKCRFVFVGTTDSPSFVERLTRHSNVVFVKSVPHSSLATIIRTFDVAIVPHLDNKNTRGNDLLKILDYFACGVPVVTTRCSDVDRYSSALYIADSHDQFIGLIGALLSGQVVHSPSYGEQIARAKSWNNTVPELVPWMFDDDGEDLKGCGR